MTVNALELEGGFLARPELELLELELELAKRVADVRHERAYTVPHPSNQQRGQQRGIYPLPHS
jgi:hypothetical protein